MKEAAKVSASQRSCSQAYVNQPNSCHILAPGHITSVKNPIGSMQFHLLIWLYHLPCYLHGTPCTTHHTTLVAGAVCKVLVSITFSNDLMKPCCLTW